MSYSHINILTTRRKAIYKRFLIFITLLKFDLMFAIINILTSGEGVYNTGRSILYLSLLYICQLICALTRMELGPRYYSRSDYVVVFLLGLEGRKLNLLIILNIYYCMLFI